jgi:hypothetical protein
MLKQLKLNEYKKGVPMFCLNVVVVCRCLSSTDALLWFFLVWNANTFYKNMFVFLFICGGKGMFFVLCMIAFSPCLCS